MHHDHIRFDDKAQYMLKYSWLVNEDRLGCGKYIEPIRQNRLHIDFIRERPVTTGW